MAALSRNRAFGRPGSRRTGRIVKLTDRRPTIPAEMPHMEGHNTWCANVEGSTLVWPVADVAQHVILLLLYLGQNGTASMTT